MIVESPAKARTIKGYLGPEFDVRVEHRAHPRPPGARRRRSRRSTRRRRGRGSASNVDNDFEPLYVVDPEKKKRVADLKKLLKDADELLLATDEDREGEAIAWHLRQVLKPKVPVRRMVFHEITRDAIERALDETRDIDERLVDAQETRRILDRLYGYEVSPVLWKKIMPRLSAGRVQSVATRLVVERERARTRVRRRRVLGHRRDVRTRARSPRGSSRSTASASRRGATSTRREASPPTRSQARRGDARALADALDGAAFSVRSVEQKPYTRRPAAPFMTSTLQQEASRKLRFTAQTTMRVAQRLYENGYITYMRTDSTTLAESALTAARDQARELYGAEYVPEKPRRYDRKVKNAQEAHEAIRPAGDRFRTPQQVQGELSRDEHALYDLIWKRTIASQMKDATRLDGLGAARRARVDRRGRGVRRGRARRSRSAASSPRTRRAATRPPRPTTQERLLPPLNEGDALDAQKLEPQGHTTTPPARYTEATLVRALEERGIGRPSTYASIIGTILDRGYVFKRGTALVPSFLAFSVVALLEQHFGKLVDYDFTARMEDDLDRIADGDEQRVEWLKRFYFGSDGDDGLHDLVTRPARGDRRARHQLDRDRRRHHAAHRALRAVPRARRTSASRCPTTSPPDELTVEAAEELLAKPSGDRELGVNPETGRAIVARDGPLRAVRRRAAAGGLGGEAADGVALQVDVARDGDARRGAAAALAAARPRQRRTARR